MDRSESRYATLCADAVRKFLFRFRQDATTPLPLNRRETVNALEQALARRGRRLAFRKQIIRGGAISAAAMVLLVAGVVTSRRLPGRIDLGSSGRADRALTVLGSTGADRTAKGVISGGMILEPGTGLVAPATSEVRIGTADGTALTLERGGELTVVEQSAVQRFTLRGGAIRARVSKLRPAERFIITTDDAEVEVHGTAFRVAMVPADPACGGGVRTRVSVFEGVVSVRSGGAEAFIPAGAEWPAACAATPEPVLARQLVERKPEARKPDTRATVHGAANRKHAARRTVGAVAHGAMVVAANDNPAPAIEPAPRVPASILGVQNDMFAAAIRAKRHRRIDDSVSLFSQLIDTYPDGPLTEGAMAQRMKLLAGIDEQAAARAASEYLARFRGGFARVEARRLAGGTP